MISMRAHNKILVVDDDADLIKISFSRLAAFVKCRDLGSVVIPLCTTPDAMTDQALSVVTQLTEFN